MAPETGESAVSAVTASEVEFSELAAPGMATESFVETSEPAAFGVEAIEPAASDGEASGRAG